jgi:hypothetical protein
MPMQLSNIWIWITLGVAPACANAQWINHPMAGAPRTRDGNVNLTAKAPHLRDGKPDLSGIWQIENPTREERYQFFFDGINNLGEDPPSKYFMNILYDFKPEDAPMRPEAAALLQQHRAGLAKDIPATRCLPFGMPLMNAAPFPYKVIQTPGEIILLYEHDTTFRQVFTDGRKHPADPTPSWLGYSVGKWEGNTLVVDTIGFNDRGWLDAFGHPHSQDMRVTERFRRPDFGHMDVQITVDDPKMYTKPFTITLHHQLLPDTDLLESICAENEQDGKHMPK